ncbi:hypothetical protein FOL47_000142 [Perkinsus chesapeaki]|uniref:Chitinase n=1 Tax=Perkinsus chesapeaki TaxID=330153 RepID=A0A7J6N2K5_PERCH|nr:hypothetical protein FOL47_000142 [Perkinsus chesapeaki]
MYNPIKTIALTVVAFTLLNRAGANASLRGLSSCLTTGDAFCQNPQVQGPGSYCTTNSHVCHGGVIPCNCVDASEDQLSKLLGGGHVVNEVVTKGAAPRQNTARVLTHQPPKASARVDGSFMWVEFPEIYDLNALSSYYDKIYNHIMGNQIGMGYSQVVVRVTTPDDALTGTRSSPLYTHLLNRIAGKMQVLCYPDVTTNHGKRDQWVAASPIGSFLDGAIQYAARNGDIFTGVVYDTEEFTGTPSYNKLLNNDNSEIRMAASEGLTTALTCGFDEVTRPDNRGSKFLNTVDHLYLQMYDFYNNAGKPIASSPSSTPFVTHQNDANGMYNYLFSGKSDVKAVKYTESSYTKYSQQGKISMMWSTSFNTSPDCIHPLNGQCGDTKAHYEFGVWEGSPFVSFLANVKGSYPQAPQGVMQFAFMPKSWDCAISAQQQLQDYLGGNGGNDDNEEVVGSTTKAAPKPEPPAPSSKVDGSFMWVEFPEIYDVNALGSYYDKIYNHIMGNQIGMGYSQVVVRVTTPDDALTATRSSPLYTHLLNRIAGKMQVVCYPDLGSDSKRGQWTAASPMGSYLDGAIQYAARNGDIFTGVVYDTEEFTGTPSYNKLLNNDNSEIRMAASEGLTTALTCGFDEVTRPDNRGSKFLNTVDHLYLQMYDFYNNAGKPIASSPSSTPFVAHQNDANGMYNYLFSGNSDVKAVKQTESSYAKYSQQGKISMMWSTSFNTSPNCMKPLNGQCGDTKAHYEFGVWDGVPFVDFASKVKADYPNAPQGIMQFAFMPQSWE